MNAKKIISNNKSVKKVNQLMTIDIMFEIVATLNTF